MSWIIVFTIAIFGWIVGFISSVVSSYFMDRRRVVHALASELESVRAEMSDYAKFGDIHKRAVESLKPLFFAAIPFLKGEKKDYARKAWASFTKTDISQFPTKSAATELGADLGDPEMTNRKEMERLLDNIQSSFNVWP